MAELRCFDDVDSFGAETLDELEDLSQDLYHRLIERRGANLDDPDRGLGIEDMLSGTVSSELKNEIESELLKDPRVSLARASIASIDDGGVRIEIAIEIEEDEINLVLESDASGNVVRVPA